MASAAGRTVREGSAVKRAAILAAARELFLADGYDRTSVDAVAARAQVSKRTVYDYFGDKQALLGAVVEQAGQSLLTTVRSALDAELAEPGDLAAALIDFAARISTTAFESSDYALLMRLVGSDAAHLAEPTRQWLANAPEDAIAERFAELGRMGLLEVPDPRVAAEHFGALTLLLATNRLGSDLTVDRARARTVIEDGVHAFLRAYAPRV